MSQRSANHAAIKHLTAKLIGTGALINETRALANRIEKAAAELVELHDKPDPLVSELGMNIRREAARESLKKLVAEAKEKSAGLLLTEKRNIDQNRAQIAALQPSIHGAEIRSVFRGLSEPEKLRFLDDAIRRGDGETVGSLVQVPLSISGMTAQQQTDYRSAFIDKAAPLDVAYVGETEAAAAGIFQAAETMLGAQA